MNRKLVIIIGLITILISISTWAMDLTGLVEKCIYCRSERTVIGLNGIVFLFPAIKYLTSYICTALGFFGVNVASAQIFLNLEEDRFGIMFFLAIGALLIIVMQIILAYYFELYGRKNKILS